MLLELVNLADVARGMGPQDPRSGKGGGPSLKVRPPAPQVEQTSGVAKAGVAKTGRDGGNVRGEAVSDRCGSGARLDRRAELVKLAQPLLDQGLPESEVHAALQEFVQHKEWGYLSPVTLEGIVESALDALVDAEMDEDVTQQRVSLVPELDELLEVSLADITPEPVRWLWPGKIPLNKVTVIYGEAGIGKTSLGLDLAARVSAGISWPDGSGAPEAGRVLMVNGEDSVGDSICPRLTSSGANLKNISVIAGMQPNGTRSGCSINQPLGVSPRFGQQSTPISEEPDANAYRLIGQDAMRVPSGMQPPATNGSPGATAERGTTGTRGFDLGRDLPVLRSRIETLGNVRLVIIDPLEAYLGKIGSNRVKLRELVASLTKLAADCGVAIVVISAASKCELPVKHVWRVDCEVLDGTARCWVPVRHNCGALPDGLAFRITDVGVAWQPGREAPTESRVRGTSARQARCRQLQEQAAWLRDFLSGEPRPAKEVLAAAGAAGWSTGQIKRAKWELGIRCYKESAAKGRWFWDALKGEERRVKGEEVEEFKEVEGVKEFKEVSLPGRLRREG